MLSCLLFMELLKCARGKVKVMCIQALVNFHYYFYVLLTFQFF